MDAVFSKAFLRPFEIIKHKKQPLIYEMGTSDMRSIINAILALANPLNKV